VEIQQVSGTRLDQRPNTTVRFLKEYFNLLFIMASIKLLATIETLIIAN
jgi:hypothetical protein